jgi:hypothetical protein
LGSRRSATRERASKSAEPATHRRHPQRRRQRHRLQRRQRTGLHRPTADVKPGATSMRSWATRSSTTRGSASM